MVHRDNAPVYHSKMTRNCFEHSPLKKLLCPLYLPEISPLDFYLFGKIKSTLIGQEIPDEIGLVAIETQMLDGILNKKLQTFFRSWIECVQKVIDSNGNYIS
jgi:hypothetical protein